MQTHKTIEDARLAAQVLREVRCIVEIDHATEGRCYIKSRVPMANLDLGLKAQPIPEIRRLIAEHPLRTEAELAADREQALREHSTCARCGKKIDGNTAYSQREMFCGTHVTAFYCESCRTLLAGIGAGEYTELQERASARPSYEPYTKED